MKRQRGFRQHSSWAAWGLLVCLLLVPAGPLFSVTLEEITPLNFPQDKSWQSVAMSSDGSKILAAASRGRLYLSVNGGVGWTEPQPAGDVDRSWSSVALTTDGSKMLAADNDGKVYIKSGDGPWVETMPLTDLPESGPPTTASMSSDGSTVLARARDGRLYQYVNENWVALVSPQNTSGFCRFLALSPDGSKILAEFDNRLYLYGGIAWAEVRPAGDVDRNWSSVALTADGSKMLAASYGGLYLYDNGTWSEAQPAPGGPYEWIGAISADGSRIVAAASYGLYTYHGGAWTGIWVAGYSGTIWRSLTLSPDGSKFLVALDQRIYLGSEQEFETPLSNGVALTDTISQSHVRGTWKYYYVDLPEGVTDFVINLTGLTGDADLYVRWGDRSYSNNYDCVSWRDGSSNEQCYLMSPRPGRWYIMITNADPGTINYTLEATWVTNGPFTISGVVRNSSTREPIAGATVGVMDSNNQTVSTTTDDLGRFSQTIPIYEPGLYRVFAQALYYTSGPPAEVQVDSSHPTTSVTIELQPRNDLHVINLSPGWNFVSTPRQLQPPANLMENVMAGIASSLDIIWTYNSATRAWLVYRPSGSGDTNTLTTFDSGQGYWLHMRSPAQLFIIGSNGSREIELSDGWNLVGYNGADATAVAAGLGTLTGKWTVVWGWAAGTWSLHHYLFPDNQLPGSLPALLHFNRGKAYWIKVKNGQSGTWSQ